MRLYIQVVRAQTKLLRERSNRLGVSDQGNIFKNKYSIPQYSIPAFLFQLESLQHPLPGWQFIKPVLVCLHICMTSVMSDSLWSRRLLLTRLLWPWDFPGKNTRAGCQFPIPGDLLHPWIKPESFAFPVLAGRFFTASPSGKAKPVLDIYLLSF